MIKDFFKYARSNRNIPTTTLEDYVNKASMNVNPTILEERKLNVAQLDIFSRLQADRIFLGEAIDDEVANIIQAQLLYLSSINEREVISLYINSPGGYVTSGLGIYDTMQFVEPRIHTICVGEASSMAAILLSAGDKGNRAILPHSRVMIHQPSGGTWGQVTDVLIHVAELEKAKKETSEILAYHTGKDIETIYKDVDRDYFMSAQEAVDYGICDKILTKAKK